MFQVYMYFPPATLKLILDSHNIIHINSVCRPKEHHLLDAPLETWTFASGSPEREVASGHGVRRGRLFVGKLLGVGKALGEFSHDWLWCLAQTWII